MSLSIKLKLYEGPLDLLLDLVEKHKLNIYDIAIGEITDQYLEEVKRLAEEDLELASEFLIMAARLILIKSKTLLPKDEKEEAEGAEMKKSLEMQLIEYKKIKSLLPLLFNLQKEGEKYFFRKPFVPTEIASLRKKADPFLEFAKSGYDVGSLKKFYLDVLRRNIRKKDKVRGGFGEIKAEPVDAKKRLVQIKRLLEKNKQITFKSLIENDNNKQEKVVTFLILLEMAKAGEVSISQDGAFKELDIRVNSKT